MRVKLCVNFVMPIYRMVLVKIAAIQRRLCTINRTDTSRKGTLRVYTQYIGIVTKLGNNHSRQSQKTGGHNDRGSVGKTTNRHPSAVLATKYLGEMIAIDLQPYSIIENEGVLRYSHNLEPRFSLPSRRHLSERDTRTA